MLPSAISAPSPLPPMMSAVSGTTTVKPKSPRIRLGQSEVAGWEALSARVTRMRITAGTPNSRARLRPSVARSVIEATVPLNMPDMGSLAPLGFEVDSGRQQVGEDAFQRLIRREQLKQPDVVFAGQHRELTAERAVVIGPHLQPLGGQLHAGHRPAAEQGGADQPLFPPAD